MKFSLGLCILTISTLLANAQTYIDPIDNGSVTSTGTDKVDYVVVGPGSNNEEGALVFSTASFQRANSETFDLEINAYGEPMWVNTINVYGYTSNSATFSSSNYGEGTLLGTYTNLSSAGYGQQELMNITSFVDSVQTSDFGILLQAVGSNVGVDDLSSTRYYLGDPSAILEIPEPSTLLQFLALLFASLPFLRLHRRRA